MNNTICTAGDHNFPIAGVRKPFCDYLWFETSAPATAQRLALRFEPYRRSGKLEV